MLEEDVESVGGDEVDTAGRRGTTTRGVPSLFRTLELRRRSACLVGDTKEGVRTGGMWGKFSDRGGVSEAVEFVVGTGGLSRAYRVDCELLRRHSFLFTHLLQAPSHRDNLVFSMGLSHRLGYIQGLIGERVPILSDIRF